MLRIIAGEWRGRKLKAPVGDTTRPTADRTRETLFSMLTSRLGSFEELSVLDLFAGSGALGLEALSRGAATLRVRRAGPSRDRYVARQYPLSWKPMPAPRSAPARRWRWAPRSSRSTWC